MVLLEPIVVDLRCECSELPTGLLEIAGDDVFEYRRDISFVLNLVSLSFLREECEENSRSDLRSLKDVSCVAVDSGDIGERESRRRFVEDEE